MERRPQVPNKFLAQFAVVVDLTIEDNRVTTAGGRERLVTAGQINNRQTAKSQSYLAIEKAPESSGPRWRIASIIRDNTLESGVFP